MTRLYIFSGLPGSGKTTLAQMLSAELRCVHLRIDTIEQALRDLCGVSVEGEGYRLAYRVAQDNLKLGISVVADSCNPIELTRREWRAVAHEENCEAVDIEVLCSNTEEHKSRVEGREIDIQNLVSPTWQEVIDREYDPWVSSRLVIDTAGVTANDSFKTLKTMIANRQGTI